jgi:hypothetical protein
MSDANSTNNFFKSKPLITIGLLLKQRGFHVVPIATGTKAPVGVIGWQSSDYTAEQLERFVRGGSKYTGWGILLGYPTSSGKSVYMLDVDCADADVAAAISRLVVKWFGEDYLYRIGNPPKFAVPFLMDDSGLKKRKTAPFFKGTDPTKCLVEVLSFGQQAVCYAEHPDINKPYEWHNGQLAECDVDKLPVLSVADVTAILSECVALFGQHGYTHSGSGAEIEDESRLPAGRRRAPLSTFTIEDAELLLPLVNQLYPEFVDSYDMWVKVGMAMHHQFGGDTAALDLWDEWSRAGKEYEEGVCKDKWLTFNAHVIGGFTIRSLLVLPNIKTWWYARTYKFGNVVMDNFNNRDILTDDDRLEDELTARFAFMINNDRFYDTMSHTWHSRLSLNTRWARPPMVDEESGRTVPRVKPTVLLERSGKLVVISGLSWHPSIDKVIEYEGKKFYNTFKPWQAEAVAGDLTDWFTVCHHVWGEHTDAVLDWMAFSLQYPETKIKWQVLVHGAPRTGKTLAAKPWLRLFESAGQEVSQELVSAGWGDIYFKKKALTFEEVWAPQNRGFFNSLKSKLVNDNMEAINIKGQPITYQQNLYSIYMCSNHIDALMFSADDDKLLVIQAPDQRLPDEEYAKLATQTNSIDTPLMKAVYSHLMSRDVENFDYGKLPVRTDAAVAMAENSASEFEEDLAEALKVGLVPFERKAVTRRELVSYLKESRFYYSRTQLTEFLRKSGLGKYRGMLKSESKVVHTPEFYTSEDLAGLSPTEIYKWYMANASTSKFSA